MIQDRNKNVLENHVPPYFENIEERFGHNTSQTLKSWISLSKKYKKIVSHIEFLLKCRRDNNLPKHLDNISNRFKQFTFKTPFLNEKVRNKIEHLKKNLLNIEIRDAHFRRMFLKNDLKVIENQLEHLLLEHILIDFFKVQDQVITTLWKN